MRNTGDDLGTPGFDPYYGYGRINADSALRLDRVGPLAVAKRTIDDDGTAPSVGNGDGVINAGETVPPGEQLTAGDNNLGWLYYAMLDICDDRYIPFLLEGAKQGAITDIKILGRRQVKEAVPDLERLLTSSNPSVEENARIALQLIREKK